MLGVEINTEIGLQRVRLFLLFFVLHFFILQPILNTCFPELAERVLSSVDLEECEKEDLPDRTIGEEEIMHASRPFFSFDQTVVALRKSNFVHYFYQRYFCVKADVHTPPPESLIV